VLAKQLAQDTGNITLFEKSTAIEAVMNREKAAKGIYPNVDFYSATTYHCIGLPLDLFTPMLRARACGRVVGARARAARGQPPVPARRGLQGPARRAYTPMAAR
jgi:citrate synthase